MLRRILFVFALAGIGSLPAADRPVQLSADHVAAAANGVSVAKGNARISGENFLLTADEMHYDQREEKITALGHVVMTRAEVRLLADKLVYLRRTDSFDAENIRLGRHPYFVEGFSASGTRDEITVRRARASYGEPGPWQPTINADTIVFAPNNELRSENVTIGIGHAQPVPIPRFDYKLGAPLIGTVNLTGGYRRSLGVFADGSLHIPVSAGVRLGADIGVFTNRGLMVGPSGRYTDVARPEQLRGYFRSGYINDHGDKKTDIVGRRIPEERAFAEWQHQQLIGPHLTLNAQLNWWKDSEVVRDFRPRAFFPVQTPDTFIESVHTGNNFFISAFARFQPNRFHRVQQRLPEVRFDLLPLPLGEGFYQRFEASVAVLREDTTRSGPFYTPRAIPAVLPAGITGPAVYLDSRGNVVNPSFFGPAFQTTRADAYYGISRPIIPNEWFNFTPVAGARLTSYSRTRDEATFAWGTLRAPVDVVGGGYTRLLGEVGADAVLRTNGTFDYKNPQWKIDGLRHLLTPRLSYRYIPEADKGRARILPIDRRVFSTYLQPLGLGDQRNIDDLHATNTLRLSIDNILQTRDPVHGTRDLVAFNLANDFRFRRAPGERDVSEIHADLALMPAPWLQFELYQSFVPQSGTLRELNSAVTVYDGRVWSVRFGNNYLQHEIQDYSIEGRTRINERFEGLARLRYDHRRRRFNEQAYGVVQNLGNTWLVSYTISLYSGRRRESNFGFNVEIQALSF